MATISCGNARGAPFRVYGMVENAVKQRSIVDFRLWIVELKHQGAAACFSFNIHQSSFNNAVCYTRSVRRLIINADDFGFTSGVNRAIVEAHNYGVVTSSTLMAGGRAFAEAVQMAKATPKLGVGCHVVLIDGTPVSTAEALPSLTSAGEFRDGLKSFVARALAGRMNAEEIATEASAQIRRVQSAGISVSHIDTHKHTHIFPQILKPILRAARGCGV